MFLKARFGPAAVVGAMVPRIFVYENVLDSLHTMTQPGYFNEVKTVLTSNSRIEVIASDYHASLFILGVVDGQLCAYKDSIKCPRRDAILPKMASIQITRAKTKKAGKTKKGKAA